MAAGWCLQWRYIILSEGALHYLDPNSRIGRRSSCLRVREKITSQNWRSDLVQVWLIRESKTTGIASYFEAFESEVSAKDGLKMRCENVKLFLREP